MKTPIILIAAALLAIASCNKNMPVPDTGSDQTFFPDLSYDPSDPSDPSDPGNYSGDNGDDPGNYSGDDGSDDSGDDGSDDSGDDGNKYKGHVHHAVTPKTVTASKPSGSH
jgi:hypothetical protein